MTFFKFVFVAVFVGSIVPATANAQVLMESYTAEIASVDRRNSSGNPLSKPEHILAQDRANVHRFGRSQPGDTFDSVFGQRDARASFGRLLAQGSISPQAREALASGRQVLLTVSIYGSGNRPSYVAVDLNGEQKVSNGISRAELLRNARNVQAALNELGFDAGPVDGQPGRKTTNAIAEYQRSVGALATGQLTSDQLAALLGLLDNRQAGPSFDCSKAATATEIAICNNNNLAQLDRDLAGVWNNAQTSENRANLLVSQRKWLVQRDACGGDVQCIETHLRARIDQLGGSENTQLGVARASDRSATDLSGEELSRLDSSGDLILMDGLPIWGYLPREMALPEGSVDLALHESELAARMIRSLWFVAENDLSSALMQTTHTDVLERYYKVLPESAQRRLVELGYGITNPSEFELKRCENEDQMRRMNCATRKIQTRFEQRRFVEGATPIIVEAAQKTRFEFPIDVIVFCRVGAVDEAYDFDRGAIVWGKIVHPAGCDNPNSPMNYLQSTKIEPALDLSAGMPDETPMSLQEVERLNDMTLEKSTFGRQILKPLVLAFKGQIVAERTDGHPDRTFRLHPTKLTLKRTGPISLRWSGSPEKTILSFDSEGPQSSSVEAIDLFDAEVVHALIEDLPAIDSTQLAQITKTAFEGSESTPVKIPANLNTREVDDLRLTLANRFNLDGTWQQFTALAGYPDVNVGHRQLQGRREIPDRFIAIVFPSAVEDLQSKVLEAEISGLKGMKTFLVGNMTKTIRLPHEAGDQLVAFVVPSHFEISTQAFDGSERTVASIPIEEFEPRQQIFVPPAYWFAAKAMELSGGDKVVYLNGLFDSANLHRGDTFARYDAIQETLALTSSLLSQNEGEAPWIVGKTVLGPYDLEKKAWPVRRLDIQLPVRDGVEKSLERRLMPNIDVQQLMFPMPIPEARALQVVLKGSQSLPFRARLAIGPPSEDSFAPQGRILEIALLPPPPYSSQRVNVPSSFRPGEELATIVIAAEEPTRALSEPPIATPTPQPQPIQQEAQPVTEAVSLPEQPETADEAPKSAWPEVPAVQVKQSSWDMVRLRTGMSIAEAEAVLKQRGIVAAFERPFEEVPDGMVKSVRFQRLYITSKENEAISIAAVGPDGPVLAIMRRILRPRGDLPFLKIQKSLEEKYGPAAINTEQPEGLAFKVWYSGDPGFSGPACGLFITRAIALNTWGRLPEFSSGEVNVDQLPAAWHQSISDFPIERMEAAKLCETVIFYRPESARTSGASAFSIVMVDVPKVLEVDEALMGLSEPESMEIDF